MDIRRGYKALTHDLYSPLPQAAEWRYSASVSDALRTVGLWMKGRPTRVFEVQASADAVQHMNERHASQLTILRECDEQEITTAIEKLSVMLAPHVTRMVDEQLQWWHALARPQYDAMRVETALGEALRARGLTWHLQKFATVEDASEACCIEDAQVAQVAWINGMSSAAWGAWFSWYIMDADDARTIFDIWYVWSAKNGIMAAGDAKSALVVCYTSLQKLIAAEAMTLTIGIRDAYTYGLEFAFPINADTLGWAMAPGARE